MKLPDIAYEAEFSSGYNRVTYFPELSRRKSKVRLPDWLAELISDEISEAKQNARNEVKDEFLKILGK